MLTGLNDEPVLVSGSVEFGLVGGRDANVAALQMLLTVYQERLVSQPKYLSTAQHCI